MSKKNIFKYLKVLNKITSKERIPKGMIHDEDSVNMYMNSNKGIKEILDFLKEPQDGKVCKAIFEEDSKLLLEYITNLEQENKRLKEQNKIYKLRHTMAIKKLSFTINHYNLENKNDCIINVKNILEGNSIDEKSYKILNGGK